MAQEVGFSTGLSLVQMFKNFVIHKIQLAYSETGCQISTILGRVLVSHCSVCLENCHIIVYEHRVCLDTQVLAPVYGTHFKQQIQIPVSRPRTNLFLTMLLTVSEI